MAIRRPPRRLVLVALGILLALIILAITFANFYTDVLWFDELGKSVVFWTILRARLLLGVFAGVVTAATLWVNLWLVERVAPPYRLLIAEQPGSERFRVALGPYLGLLRWGLALFIGFIAGIEISNNWQSLLLWQNAKPFHVTDPVFHLDIGFYVFSLPFYEMIFGWLFTVLVLALVFSAVGHFLLGGIRPQLPRRRITPAAQAHLSVLLGCIVLLKAWGYRLNEYQLLYSTRGIVYNGASYTDLHAQLPALRLLVLVAIVCALLFFIGAWMRSLLLPGIAIALLCFVSIVIGGIVPFSVQKFAVAPNELQKEAPYLARSIDATRHAYGLNTITVTQYPASGTLTQQELAADPLAVSNIRLWDASAFQPAIDSLQAIGQYYSFQNTTVDRYDLPGGVRQVLISGRDVNPSLLQSSAQTWQNVHLAYTHGYGVVAALVNTADSQGLPQFLDSGFDQATAPIPVTQPRIYFGDLPAGSPAYVIADTKQPEVDAPSANGSASATYTYQGSGGIQLSSGLRRLAFAVRFHDLNILISGYITPQSRLMFNRDISSRIQQVAPFIQWDSDPYIAVVDGQVYFIRDGYTSTDMYPYSQRVDLGAASGNDAAGVVGVTGQANYIRNSVKAVVNAYTGKVTLYAYDPSDPILQAWESAFPGLFAPRSQIDAALQAHLRYPEDLFSVQASVFAAYHITNPASFYSKSDLWQVPADTSGPIQQSTGQFGLATAPLPMRPYYLLTQLPGTQQEQFVLVLPFSPNGKQNMVSYLAAHLDPATGDLLASEYSLPRSRLISGPDQVNARILQTPAISRDLSLLNQQGSTVTLGNLLTVPIGGSLLYVQPIFVKASQNAIPELRFVAVFFNGNIGYAATLESSIDDVLQAAPPTSLAAGGSGGSSSTPAPGRSPTTTTLPSGPTTPLTGTARQLLAQANVQYALAQQALRTGDLAGYQQHINQVGALIQRALKAGGSRRR